MLEAVDAALRGGVVGWSVTAGDRGGARGGDGPIPRLADPADAMTGPIWAGSQIGGNTSGPDVVALSMRYSSRVAGVLLAGVLAAGCGSAAEEAGPASNPDGAEQAEGSVVPEVAVLDVPTGDEIQLTSLVDSDRPTLLWMWAPH